MPILTSWCFIPRWNGLIGGAPGHPVFVRAVERLVNFIRDRADIYDMEQETCRRVGSNMAVWKVRAQPLLFLSGPCGLGVSVNEALDLPSLATIRLGWLTVEVPQDGAYFDWGDALILVGDKNDLGEFRISDPERSFIVASTDIKHLDKSPRQWGNPIQGELRRQAIQQIPLPHYSNSKRGVSIWGSANVYKDDLIGNDQIRLNVHYIDTS
jgi:hypothetical protein